MKNNLDECPNCGGPADNGFDRSIPPNPYFCTKCMEDFEAMRPSGFNKKRGLRDFGRDQPLESVNERLAPWLSAALEDEAVCKEFKDVIQDWFEEREREGQ